MKFDENSGLIYELRCLISEILMCWSLTLRPHDKFEIEFARFLKNNYK